MRARPEWVVAAAVILIACAAPALGGGGGEAARKGAPSLTARLAKVERQVRALLPLPARVKAIGATIPTAGPPGAQGPAGPTGTPGAAGPAGSAGPPGASEASSATAASGSLTQPDQTLVALAPAPGAYIVFANVALANPTGSAVTVDCELRSGAAALDFASTSLGPAGGADQDTLEMTGAADHPAGAGIALLCTGAGATWTDADLMALRVGSVG